MKEIYDIRGHHLVDISDYLYQPEKVKQHYLAKGYGTNFVDNQTRIFNDFISGRSRIKLIAGLLDDICLGDCKRREIIEQDDNNIGCEDQRGIKVDTQIAGWCLLEIEHIYSFLQIESNLRNFYLDAHST